MIRIRRYSQESSASNGPPARGYSLVEMLVVISASAAVLMVTYTMLVMVMKRTAKGGNDLARSENLQRVVARFRQTVQIAAMTTITADGTSLELAHDPVIVKPRIRLSLADHPFRLELTDLDTGRKQIFGLGGYLRGIFRVEKPEGYERSLVSLELWPIPERFGTSGQHAAEPITIQAALATDPARVRPVGGQKN